MKHLILGAGNLGLDLQHEIETKELGDVETQSLSTGLDVTNTEQLKKLISETEADYIWYCVGFGSVEQVKKEREKAIAIHLRAPHTIMNMAPYWSKIIFFSSDHVADEAHPDRADLISPIHRSEFAKIKSHFEILTNNFGRANTAVVRIGSLYGLHKPLETFPGRILRTFGPNPDLKIRLPQNLVTPTPTLWLASVLLSNLDSLFNEDRPLTHHCAPSGNVSVWDWATFVLQGLREPSAFTREKFIDQSRPELSALDCSFLQTNWHWNELWNTYFKPEWYSTELEDEPGAEDSEEPDANPPQEQPSAPPS